MTTTKDLVLVNKYGMHVRPAGAFAKTCQKYVCDVTVENGGASVSGKSVLGLMTLEAPVGTVLKVTADGPDADLALAELEELVANHFGIADE
ncbi:MAG: HPr family phosphocarrier protein [Kiritimatiellae bacterium]|nr:HPr family phosphocarrier protein [Kiritimatiellia bacterium]MBR1837237.1 HPr family phosphocarrier protein [Kiritimatiellia bacterium]